MASRAPFGLGPAAASAPPGGWLSLVLVVAMCFMLALAIDDARIILGRGALTDLLVWAAIAGALLGSLGPTIGWGRWTTYALGAIFAALIVPLLVGSSLRESEGDRPRCVPVEAEAVWAPVTDLIVLSGPADPRGRPPHAHPGALGLGARRCSRATRCSVIGGRSTRVLLIGLILVANMALTFQTTSSSISSLF